MEFRASVKIHESSRTHKLTRILVPRCVDIDIPGKRGKLSEIFQNVCVCLLTQDLRDQKIWKVQTISNGNSVRAISATFKTQNVIEISMG